MQPVVTVLALLGVLIVLFVAAVVATRSEPVLAEAPPDGVGGDLPSRPLQAEDVAAVRFDLALRGYRMREVDELLERLAGELRARDARIAALEQPPAPDEPSAAGPAEQSAPAPDLGRSSAASTP